MFKGSKNTNTVSASSNEMNHIGQGTKIIGDMISKGNLRLDGELEGSLISETRVVLGEGSQLSGTLKAQNAEISGFVKGKIEVEELLVIKPKAVIEGDIKTGKINIEAGAIHNGSTVMGGQVKGINPKNVRKQGQEKSA